MPRKKKIDENAPTFENPRPRIEPKVEEEKQEAPKKKILTDAEMAKKTAENKTKLNYVFYKSLVKMMLVEDAEPTNGIETLIQSILLKAESGRTTGTDAINLLKILFSACDVKNFSMPISTEQETFDISKLLSNDEN